MNAPCINFEPETAVSTSVLGFELLVHLKVGPSYYALFYLFNRFGSVVFLRNSHCLLQLLVPLFEKKYLAEICNFCLWCHKGTLTPFWRYWQSSQANVLLCRVLALIALQTCGRSNIIINNSAALCLFFKRPSDFCECFSMRGCSTYLKTFHLCTSHIWQSFIAQNFLIFNGSPLMAADIAWTTSYCCAPVTWGVSQYMIKKKK